MKIKRIFIITAVFLLLGQMTAPMSDYSVPEKPEDFTVYDNTGLISHFTREYLVALNDLLYQKCSSKTVIALFDGIG
ncbi:MAG: hypothetical protein GX827_02075 [Clostridiales bacterium]|jgi:hypothetical protein|nr:hypothetical protein [Clostridiales bacterium]